MLKHLLPVALIIVAIVSYFFLALKFGIYQLVPWPHYLIALAGCAWLAKLAWDTRRVLPWISTATGVLFTGLFVWYTAVYSMYPSRSLAVSEHETVAGLVDLRLPNQEGKAEGLFADASRGTLLVLYRGYW